MNYFVIMEKDTKNILTVDTVWSREELERVSIWNVLSQHATKLEAKTKRLEMITQ